MPTATKNYGTVKLTSSYIAYCENDIGNSNQYTGSANNANSATFTVDYATLGIPAGSTISPTGTFTYGTVTSALHGTETKTLFNGSSVSQDSWFDTGDTVTISNIPTFFIRFKTAKNNTTYPARPPNHGEIAQLTNTSVWEISNLTLSVDYTPPTAATVSSVLIQGSASNVYTAAGGSMTLSWSAANGTNNNITSYSIFNSDNGGAWASYATGLTSTSYTVSAHPTAGSNRQFYVIAYAPYGNSGTETSPLAYSYSAVSVPGGVGISPATVLPDASVTLSWTASSGGVGTTVTGYQILQNDAAKTTVSASPYVFSAPAAGSYTYKVVAISSVSGYNSGQSAGLALTVQFPVSAFTLNKSTVAMDGTSTIVATIAPLSAAYNHDVTFALDATRTSTANVAAGATTRTFTVPLAWCAGLPNATSGQASCTVVTKNGTTVVGQTTAAFAVTVPATVVPTVTLALAAVNGFGAYYLKGKSSVRLTSTAAGAQGSTIASQSLVGGGYSGSVSPFTSGVLTTVGANAVSVTVTDSRSRQATSTPASITVTDYSAPAISAVTAFRSDAAGAALESGEYAAVKANLVITALTGNSATATVRSRITGGTWGTAVAITHNTTKILSGILQNNAYEIEITLTDTVGTVSVHSATIRAVQFMFDFRMDRAGVGKLAQTTKTFTLPDDWTTNINADKLDGQHASEFAAVSHNHYLLPVQDIRNSENYDSYYDTSPSNVLQNSVTSHFAYVSGAGSSWRSLLTVKGWDGAYAAWQLIGTATTSADEELYFRSGTGALWNTPRLILHSGNWSGYCAAASHSHNYLPYLGWGGDLNAGALGSGFGFSNAPEYGSHLTFGQGAGYGAQFSTTYYNANPRIHFRTYYNEGTYTPSSWVQLIHTGNINSQAVAYRTRSDWNDGYIINNVVGQMAWKRWGNNHTIFDASAGTLPNGAVVSQTNAETPWAAGSPILMGWSGSLTFGVRVDSARTADTLQGYGMATNAGNTVVIKDANNYLYTTHINIGAGIETPGTIDRIYASYDNWTRPVSPGSAALRRAMGAYITSGTALPSSGMVTGDIFIKT